MIGAVAAAVGEREALRQDEVDLDGAELPAAPNRVVHVDVELWAIERAAPAIDRVRQRAGGQRLADGLLGNLVGVRTRTRFAGRENVFDALEAERGDQADRFVRRLLELVLQLLGRAEQVRVVLREAAHPVQAVQRAAAFEAVDGAELRIAQRQVAVRAPSLR
jgi:hypothetical protein